MSGPSLTGAVVHGYRLSGWRFDKHGHYRIWLSVKGTMSAVSFQHRALAVPMAPTGRQRTKWIRSTIRVGTVKGAKARADIWLAAKIAEVTK